MRSFITLLLLFGTFISFAQEDITAMEYYLDIDPGEGSATPVTITPGATINASFTIDQSLLSEGFHTLVIRVQKTLPGDSTAWGMQESKTFYVSPSDPVVTASIDAAEYFLDTDPGVGLSLKTFTPVSGTTIDEDFIIPSADISAGFHNLVIRLQDSDGEWSMQESKAFYVTDTDPVVVADVVAAEYFLDSDPGIGNATAISGISAGTTVDFNFIIPFADITLGFHTLVIRTQDADGLWSVQESQGFFVSSSDPIVTTAVDYAEYYLDVDPGIGAATPLTPPTNFTAGTSVDINFTIASAAFSEGFHNLVIRARDVNGQWGMQESKAIYVSNSNPLGTTEVTAIEYYIDEDLGAGNNNAIDITDAVAFDETLLATTSGLGAGMHTVSIRVLDAMGVWSLVETRGFLVDQFIGNPLDGGISSNISSYEYYIDDDPGYGAATEVDITPDAFLIDEEFTASTAALPMGTHQLGVRVTNEFGLISQSEIVEFAVCEGADVQIGALTTCLNDATLFTDSSTGVLAGDVYSWDFDGDDTEDDATVGDVSFTYPTAGTYTASLTISNVNCTAKATIQVEVVEPPTVEANASDAALCAGEALTLTGTGATSYTWENEVTDGEPFVPTGTASYTVIGTDGNGCQNSASLEVTVQHVQQPEIEIVSDNGRQIVLSSSATTGIQWFESGNEIPGETNQTLSVERTYFFGGVYTVQLTEGDCSVQSEPAALAVLSAESDLKNEIRCWPNPATHWATLESTRVFDNDKEVRLLNITGSVLVSTYIRKGEKTTKIDMSTLTSGIYLVLIDGVAKRFKIVKQ